MSDLRDYINIEHRGDMTVLLMWGREWMISDIRQKHESFYHSPYGYGDPYQPRGTFQFDVYCLPPKPVGKKPRKRTWTEAFGLRKP